MGYLTSRTSTVKFPIVADVFPPIGGSKQVIIVVMVRRHNF